MTRRSYVSWDRGHRIQSGHVKLGDVAAHYAEKTAATLKSEGFLLSAQNILDVFYVTVTTSRRATSRSISS